MMDNRHETTFGELQVDERFKKLQRSLKLAVLRQEHGKSAHDDKPSVATVWSSMSSINVDTVDSCFMPQTSSIKSEVLASSNNLRNMLFRKKNHEVRQKAMTTSSIKQFNGQQESRDRNIMPPPLGNFVHRTFKEPQGKVTLSNSESVSTLLNKSVQSSTVNTVLLKNDSSWKSIDTNGCKEYSNPLATRTISVNRLLKINRVFSNWRVMLNYRYELIIKGTLECGKIARSKPIIRRYSATCVESKYKHKYILQGNIVDERYGLPDYIRGKFYNGFPDDWENVYQIWRTYINQGCPVTFRWPTRITDSDDDLKSELTDLTYRCMKKKKATSVTGSRNLNEDPEIENLDIASEEKGKYNYSTHSFRNYDKDTSLIKPFIPNSVEEVLIPVVQTKNSMLPRDEDNKSIKSDTNLPCSSKKVNKLKDIIQEDKLDIIINNLADRNCSPQYIDKILVMLDCLDYVVSYRTEPKSNNDTVVSASHGTSKLVTIPVQQRLTCNDDSPMNFNRHEKLTEMKSYAIGHSTDLGCGSVKNDSNAVQLSNAANIESEHTNKDSGKLESMIYAGVPKISFEQVLKFREPFKKVPKRKTKRKTIYSDAENHAINLTYNASENEFKSIHVANPIADIKKNSLCDESCVSITDDEMETMSNTRVAMGITQRPQEMTLPSHREVQRNNNFDVCEKSKSTMHVQNKQLYSSSEAQKINSNVSIKKQKIPCRVQKNVPLQFVSDVDYTTNSEVEVATTSSSKRKTDGNMIALQAKEDPDIVTTSESKSEKPFASQKLYKEVIEQTKSETLMKKSKPIITSLIPINLNMKIHKVDSRAGQMHNSKAIMNEDKQNANIRPVEETDKKSVSVTSVAMSKPAINDSHSKITIDDKREAHPITNNKNEMGNRNSTNSTTNPTTEQSKSKLGVEDNPKVLIAWMPKVVYYAKSNSELGLTFQGKLVNEAGHVVHRKFTTDIVQKRLSATLIETVNHEFYKLIGHMNDSKHIIPKELMSQCRYGCPAKIEEFCLTWKTLHHVTEKLNDTTMDSLNAPISSRGRHIVPPLSYWTGERITLKDNNPVYSAGNSQDSSLLSLTNHSKETKNNTMDTKKEKQNVNSKNTSKKQSVNKRPLLPKSNKTSGTNKNQIVIEKSRTSKISPKIKAANNTRKPDNSEKFRKSINKKQLDIARKLMFYTDSSEEEQVAPRRKRMRTNQNASPEKSLPYALRKRRKMTYAYYQDVPRSDNFLSEDEVS